MSRYGMKKGMQLFKKRKKLIDDSLEITSFFAKIFVDYIPHGPWEEE